MSKLFFLLFVQVATLIDFLFSDFVACNVGFYKVLVTAMIILNCLNWDLDSIHHRGTHINNKNINTGSAFLQLHVPFRI